MATIVDSMNGRLAIAPCKALRTRTLRTRQASTRHQTGPNGSRPSML